MHCAGGESSFPPYRLCIPQKSPHYALQVTRLDPPERSRQPIGHGGSVSGELPESVERVQMTALSGPDG
jgi:hypothetical protein